MDKLARDPTLGSVLVRLMMVVNDLTLVNECVDMWRATDERKRKNRQNEALKYLIELEVAHLHEGLGIIGKINKTPVLLNAVRRCDAPTQREFDALVAYSRGPHAKSILMVRHKLAFHYDDTLAQQALTKIAQLYPGTAETVTMGHAPIDWYFGPGALVNERVAIRDVFKIPEGADVNEAANQLWEDLFEIASTFTQFAGHLAYQLA